MLVVPQLGQAAGILGQMRGQTQGVCGSGGQNFTGSFSGGYRIGTLNGAFFSSPGDAVKY
jgi:hypothetical protein